MGVNRVDHSPSLRSLHPHRFNAYFLRVTPAGSPGAANPRQGANLFAPFRSAYATQTPQTIFSPTASHPTCSSNRNGPLGPIP